MSQSDDHRLLVLDTAAALRNRWPSAVLLCDVQNEPGDPVPPMIGGYRPDIYATTATHPSVIVGEAKTRRDLTTRRTVDQVRAFLDYLALRKGGHFMLAARGPASDRAKSLLRFLIQLPSGATPRHQPTSLSVFDGHDLWCFDLPGGAAWRLV